MSKLAENVDNQRFIPFEGLHNFRDLGGYHTQDGRSIRWRRLFRSDSLHHMTESDASYAHTELGICTVIDMRAPQEVKNQGNGSLARFGAEIQRLSVIEPIDFGDSPSDQKNTVQIYLRLLQIGAPQFAEAIRTLASFDSYPAVFHCYAGRDRTGLLAALLLDVLGVDEAEIGLDYELTNQGLEHIMKRACIDYGVAESRIDIDRLWVKSETIREVLGSLRRDFGSVRGYLESIGIDSLTLEQLEDTLLEP